MEKIFLRLKKKDIYFAAIELQRVVPQLQNEYIETIEGYLRRADMEFYYKEKVKSPVWIRLTLPIALLVILMLFILLPINYMINGYWGYKIKSLTNWLRSLGF